MTTFAYKVGRETVVLHSDDRLVAVRFREPAPHSVRHKVAAVAGAVQFAERIEIADEPFTVLELGTAPGAESREHLAQRDEVERVAPVFRLGKTCLVATERVLVGLEPGADAQALATSVGGTVVRSEGDEHVIQLGPEIDPLTTSQRLAERQEVQYAEPDFVTIVPRLPRPPPAAPSAGPADAYDAQQYAIHLTQATDAWTRVRGRKEISVAVLDDGVDTSHEDLAEAVVGSFDAADDDEWQEPNSWDGHGTACAGLAVAAHNGRGVLGIAGGCSLLAVRIAQSNEPNGPWKTSLSQIAHAIDWAWRRGAAVLSNSWTTAPSNAITNAIARARSLGRGGRGCVVVFAAGNDSGPVSYPAREAGVVCVAASNEYDEPKTKTSRDGETWWGSNFGPEVTLAAPGVHNYTTDISGPGGYSRGPGVTNYWARFNGTSSATPIVAGAAAMVLSANPNLTEAQVRAILVETADKVGGVVYDADGHNHYMGHGRVNVWSAVLRALASL